MWTYNKLTKTSAVIEVDQQNCFGQLEHACVDAAIQQDHPTIAPLTLWKHAQQAEVIQGPIGRTPHTRGAQQGDVAGSFEASAALAEQARETRAHLHQTQANQNHEFKVALPKSRALTCTSNTLL